MVKSANKLPCSRPGESLKIEVTDIVQNVIIMPSYASNYKQLIVVKYSSMSSSTFRDWSIDGRLGPMRCFEVEDYEVGEVSSVFVLATEYE